MSYQIVFTDELYHHGIKGQKWGVRRYQNYNGSLTKEGKAHLLANKIHDESSKKEKRITHDVTKAIKNAGAKIYGLENRLKTKESIKRKIITDSLEKNVSLEEASKIKDSVRYTAISNDIDFVNNYFKIKSQLENSGYKEVRCKNYFDMYNKGLVKHKSVQSVYETPDGYLFEIQFQTPSSQKAKNEKLPLYEERRKPGLSNSRKYELESQMEKLAESVTTPVNIEQIKTH